MKALSIRQPYASLILGIVTHAHFPERKDVENRTRAIHYRGPLLIHAAKTMSQMERREAEYCNPYDHPYDFGALIGVVNVVDCRYRRVGDLGRFSRWHHADCYGILMEDPRVLPAPIPYKGQLGLFNVPDELIPEEFRP